MSWQCRGESLPLPARRKGQGYGQRHQNSCETLLRGSGRRLLEHDSPGGLGFDAGLSLGGNALTSADSIACSVCRRRPTRRIRAEQVASEVLRAVARATNGTAVSIDCDPATRRRTDDIAVSIFQTSGIGRWADELPLTIGGARRIACQCNRTDHQRREQQSG